MDRPISYAGNGAYCYANSLHMCLEAAGANYLPQPHELESLTLMPFGGHYFERDSQVNFFADMFPLDPDRGLTMALRNLGWECEKWSAPREDTPDEALSRLGRALETGVVLLGPIDMGCLTYNPRARGGPSGADHFVVCLALESEQVLLHDPQGYPFATLPIADLIEAWRGRLIGYAPGAFTLRADFRQVEDLSREDARSRTLTSLRQTLLTAEATPSHYGGPAAYRQVARLLRTAEPPASLTGLQHFVLPLGARRCQDGSQFLNEAGLTAAASAMARKAELYGRAQAEAVRGNLLNVAQIFDALGDAEENFTAAILS